MIRLYVFPPGTHSAAWSSMQRGGGQAWDGVEEEAKAEVSRTSHEGATLDAFCRAFPCTDQCGCVSLAWVARIKSQQASRLATGDWRLATGECEWRSIFNLASLDLAERRLQQLVAIIVACQSVSSRADARARACIQQSFRRHTITR